MNDPDASTASRPFPPASSKCTVVIYAIELSETHPATPLTPEVAAAVAEVTVTEVTQRILAEISTSATMPND
jgi:hypothetical protein